LAVLAFIPVTTHTSKPVMRNDKSAVQPTTPESEAGRKVFFTKKQLGFRRAAHVARYEAREVCQGHAKCPTFDLPTF